MSLKNYCIGNSVEYVSVEYAKSGRSACRTCKEKIGQDELRIGILVDDDHFSTGQGTMWYHKGCFHFKPRHGVLQSEELKNKIHGLSSIGKKDQKAVLDYLKDELNAIKEPKNKRRSASKSKPKGSESKKSEVKESRLTRQSASKSKPKEVQSKKEEVKSSRKTRQSASKSKSKPKETDTKKSKEKDQIKSKSAPKSKSKPKNVATKKEPVRPTTRANTRSQSLATKNQLQPEPSNKSLRKIKNPSKKMKKEAPKKFLTPAQINKYKEFIADYNKLTINELKDILQKNGQSKTGTKSELVTKCADGKQFGRIPTCSKCGGGKLRFNRDKGSYSCPGYMEDTDFINCSATFKFEDIKRLDWTE